MYRVPAKTSAPAPLPTSGADPPCVGCAPGSAVAVQLTCPCCQHPITVNLSIPALANPHRPMTTPLQPPPLKMEVPDSFRYSLCREGACWVLLFKDGRAYLKHEIGLDYVSYLLRHPNEAVSGATLFSKFHRQSANASGITALPLPDTGEFTELSDDATISEENLDKDTERILAAHRAKAQEFREMLQNPDASPSDKKFAREQLRQIIEFLDTEKSIAKDRNTCAAKRVRKVHPAPLRQSRSPRARTRCPRPRGPGVCQLHCPAHPGANPPLHRGKERRQRSRRPRRTRRSAHL